MAGASGFAGTGAWIQAWGKHRSAVSQAAKAAHFLSSANWQGVREPPVHPVLPTALITAVWVSLRGAQLLCRLCSSTVAVSYHSYRGLLSGLSALTHLASRPCLDARSCTCPGPSMELMLSSSSHAAREQVSAAPPVKPPQAVPSGHALPPAMAAEPACDHPCTAPALTPPCSG